MKIKTKDISKVRTALLIDQGGFDPITLLPISEPCLDHDHDTGRVRGVLDRRTNSWEGKVRNSFRRVGLKKTGVDLIACLRNLADYLSRNFNCNPIHPSFKTGEEKRILRNKRAKKRRKNERKRR